MSQEEIERALRLMDKKEREWLDSRKDRFKNINNMVDDLEKDKKVQKVVETFSRWQDPTIEQLRKKAKEDGERLGKMVNKLIQERAKYKEVIEEVSKIVENNFLESTLETFVCLKTTEYKNLKKILDEVKENK